MFLKWIFPDYVSLFSVPAPLCVVVVMGNGELGLLKAEVSPATWCLPYWNSVFRLSLALILPPSMRGKLITVGMSATPVVPVARLQYLRPEMAERKCQTV